MPAVLFESGEHRCVVFNDLVRGEDGVQANQFLIQHGKANALLDPGGALLYNPLVLALSNYLKPADLDYVICSHQDPDIVGSIDKWLLYSQARIVCSELWGRFVPHVVPGYMQHTGQDRYLLVPDRGGEVALGDTCLYLVPGHFMHSVGNLGVYDPVSQILFSGDIGASLVPSGEAYRIIEDDFEAHMPRMRGFHRRYMTTNKVLRLWVEMVREISPAMIVPQHGFPLAGQAMKDFLAWLEGLECGVDLLTSADYQPWKSWKNRAGGI
ncbi:MBL fold metallo-hydrolase [Lysobacteraceae bacterium NML75-0749]|nr:MBL fold metallo-hydrolase [Xanthomonadaceae bacterium NML91-0268]PJK03180.1 MBL fold metallo-hydrolase [Xanthomonadaceae bacterium NML75-0749]